MSSGKIGDDIARFEVNANGVFAEFTIAKIDGDAINPDRILLKFRTQGYHGVNLSTTENTVFIEKSYTRVLSHWFRTVADLMDKWYKE